MSDHLTSLFERYRQHNDLRALAKLFDAVAPELASVAAHMSRTADEAEDLVQATFLSAIERSANFDASRPVVPWFLGILALHARKQRAKGGRDLDPERVHQPGSADPEREAQGREITSAVGSAVEQLDPNYAPLVRRYLLDGANASTLAQEFQLNPITARVRLHRGLKQLRARLPVGISLAGLGSTLTLVDLTSVRASVLRRASQITGSAVPVASIASGALVLALLTPVALAIPAWLVWRIPGSVSEGIALVAPAAEAAPEASSIEVIEASPEARELAEALEPDPSSNATSAAIASQARVRGRLQLPDGSPAAGAVVDLDGMVGNSDLAEQFGLPIQWTDPAPMICGEQGEFDLGFDAPPAYQFSFSAQAESCAEARWRWNSLESAEVIDLGDVQLEAAGTLVVHLVNAEGQALGGEWTVRADATAPNTVQRRDPTSVSVTLDQVGAAFTLAKLPARRVTLSAGTQNFATIEKRVIEVIEGTSTPVQLVYSGPDPAARIGVQVGMPRGVFQAPSPEHIWLTRPGVPARHPEPVPGHCNFAFDGVAPGPYDVSIDDPRFSSWSKNAVQPGATVRPMLLGTAALSLRILQPDQTPYLGRYRLKLAKLGGANVGNVNLVSINQEPPPNGLVGGLMPGDYEFELSFPEQQGPRRLSVLGLAAHETRELEIPVGVPLGVQGRVVTSDTHAPMAGIDVQVTRGNVAGHTMGGNGQAYSNGVMIPPLDARSVTDAEGKFSFEGLQTGTWTVRCSWSKWLSADTTLELPLAAPVELMQPPHGSFTGQLLLPASVSIDDVSLWLKPIVDGEPQGSRLDMFMKRDPSELFEDGHFDLGPLPVGEVDVQLMVYSSSADGSMRSGSGPRLGVFPILAGAPQPVEIDVRATFPSAIHGRVEIDGVAASDGAVRVQALNQPPPQLGLSESSGKLTITGQFQFGGLTPNTPQRLDYTSETGWCWVLPNELQLAAGTDTDQGVIAITTVQREIQIVDAATNLPLANQRIAWRTGLDYAASQDKPEDLQKASATTNAQGKLNVRLPAGPARFVALPSGTFTPATVDWIAGNAPIVLRFAQ